MFLVPYSFVNAVSCDPDTLISGYPGVFMCNRYKRCKTSFVWGGGLPAGTSLTEWIENTLEPTLETQFGIVPSRDFDDPPYFIEHHASFMAYQANVAKGSLPAPACDRIECTTCCPNQKHRTLCLN